MRGRVGERAELGQRKEGQGQGQWCGLVEERQRALVVARLWKRIGREVFWAGVVAGVALAQVGRVGGSRVRI